MPTKRHKPEEIVAISSPTVTTASMASLKLIDQLKLAAAWRAVYSIKSGRPIAGGRSRGSRSKSEAKQNASLPRVIGSGTPAVISDAVSPQHARAGAGSTSQANIHSPIALRFISRKFSWGPHKAGTCNRSCGTTGTPWHKSDNCTAACPPGPPHRLRSGRSQRKSQGFVRLSQPPSPRT